MSAETRIEELAGYMENFEGTIRESGLNDAWMIILIMSMIKDSVSMNISPEAYDILDRKLDECLTEILELDDE